MRTRIIGLAAGVAAAAVAAGAGATAPEAAAYPAANVTVVGHGYGHGRGMGQYGAYGYATMDHWGYQQILAHYYEGTYLSHEWTTTVAVRLDELAGPTVTFELPGGLITVGGTTERATAIRVHNNGNGTFSLSSLASCNATQTRALGRAVAGSVTLLPPAGNNTSATVIRACLPSGPRAYQGSFTISGAGVINRLPIDEYVAGVVPSESPASWGAVPYGEAALQAQAVAARSYAIDDGGYSLDHGNPICDTQACQVYTGDPDLGSLGGWAAYTDRAVRSTARLALRCVRTGPCGYAGSVTLTEFSSSTGGYTAGGAFPAVPDLGDATPANGNHDWTAVLPVSKVQAAYPSVGTLSSVTVTSRNGLGALGGRVRWLVVKGSKGSVMVSGDQFAGALGLRSDWFSVAAPK